MIMPLFAACAGGTPPQAPMADAPDGAAAEAGAHGAVATITPEDVSREIGVLAHDSMAGRDTPSPELEAAAQYIAERFRSMGLEPAGDSGTYMHRWEYQLSSLRPEETEIQIAGAEDPGLEYGVDFFMVPGMAATAAGAVYLGVAGEDAPTADQRGKIVILDHPVATLDQEWQDATMSVLPPAMSSGVAGVIFVLAPEFPADAMGMLASMTAGQQAPFPVLGVTEAAAGRLVETAGTDLASLRGEDGEASIGDADLEIRWAKSAETFRPPNVAAMLPGSDPELRDTYVILTAHFDHVGIGAPDESGDSIYNGADDDASGTAAVLEMAEAFASLPEAPARSVIFLAVSGEEKGLLGSMAYAEDPPVIDIGSIVANVNMDMVGRNAPDTVIGIGQEYSTLQDVLAEIQDHHPELGLNVILDPAPEKQFFFRSDQLAFIQQGIPAVFFTTDEHEDYHEPSDEPDKINNDKVARVARLAFLLAYHIAQDPTEPEWTPDGRARIDEMLQQSPF
jgi:hypothetical protein